MSTFGGRLREVMGDLRLDQTEVCRRTGESSGNLSRWVNEEYSPKIAQAVAVADALGVSVGWLVAGQGPKWAAELEVSPEAERIRRVALLEGATVLTDMADTPTPLARPGGATVAEVFEEAAQHLPPQPPGQVERPARRRRKA